MREELMENNDESFRKSSETTTWHGRLALLRATSTYRYNNNNRSSTVRLTIFLFTPVPVWPIKMQNATQISLRKIFKKRTKTKEGKWFLFFLSGGYRKNHIIDQYQRRGTRHYSPFRNSKLTRNCQRKIKLKLVPRQLCLWFFSKCCW